MSAYIQARKKHNPFPFFHIFVSKLPFMALQDKYIYPFTDFGGLLKQRADGGRRRAL
jgi:hypothetical protein